VELTVAGRPALCGVQPVGPDGRLDLGRLGRLRVEGRPPEQIARQVAAVAGVPAGQVRVRVAEYRSRHVYLYGEVRGAQRSIPYQGPETVVHLLQRCGGVTPGAAATDIYVIRPRIAEGKPPQIFRVNVKNMAAHQDEKTNLLVQPFDEVYVGETRQSCLEKCIPPCLRPLFEAACGLCRALPCADRWLGCRERDLPYGGRSDQNPP
jgi:protein involved in polysaccharide export with SLBB domain